ncbi:TetR/AcrR family transcriptional regulator [Oleiagrimonas soli]|uniref:AcrR family transcriptional regulator n=1 Tax=Oleiagrimonas soli TaxID=1543381 RepID=A0A841KL02_9GAMM|nr:TetR/AcrR family transcriptional regulator [Oleiagrimonas soli]MBB6182758.1 AcrR family transcriptional regulator [Oleiagrimonas soli]
MSDFPNHTPRQQAILDAAIRVFGHYGYRKTTVEQLAAAADVSKPSLYQHFAGKEALFTAAMQRYLEEGLKRVEAALSLPDTDVRARLLAAMDAWFGRHLETFTPASFDVITAGHRLSAEAIEGYKQAFRAQLTQALATSVECDVACTPAELADVLFRFGLTWKEPDQTRERFLASVALCIRACCGTGAKRVPSRHREKQA